METLTNLSIGPSRPRDDLMLRDLRADVMVRKIDSSPPMSTREA